LESGSQCRHVKWPPAGGDIGYQLFFSWHILPTEHRRLCDSVKLPENYFNFPQFNPIAPQLDLIIISPTKLYGAI
jgi:hypothetical protein